MRIVFHFPALADTYATDVFFSQFHGVRQYSGDPLIDPAGEIAFRHWNMICIGIEQSMTGKIQHICIAEDDPDDYYIFSKVLREVNGAVKLTWFQTCMDLLEFLRNGNNLPELILLDMNMPKMDGQTCLENIKKELALTHIPIIILSTAISPTTIDNAYQAGAFKYYQKPFSLDEYRKLVNEMLDAFPA